jgi:muramidase (phage lysozyme)
MKIIASPYLGVAIGATAGVVAINLIGFDAGGVSYSGADESRPNDLDAFDMTASGIRYANHPMLKLVQRYESGGAYDILYGGNRFEGYGDHPFASLFKMVGGTPVKIPGLDWAQAGVPKILRGSNSGQYSTAAGRYQALAATWLRIKYKLGLQDFAPDSQDRMAFELLRECGALREYENGNRATAIGKASKIWTSLPGSNTGEAQLSVNQALAELDRLS